MTGKEYLETIKVKHRPLKMLDKGVVMYEYNPEWLAQILEDYHYQELEDYKNVNHKDNEDNI